MTGLSNKVVIITGASSGIGAATAVEFAKHGSKVVLTARDLPRLEETALKCQQAGLDPKEVLVVVGDILKVGDLANIVEKTVTTFGRLDVLVNNAGVAIPRTMMTSQVADMDAMYNIHVRSVYLLTKLALPHILKSKGNIVNVSSIASLRALPYMLPYSTAKAAQDQMMRCLSLELGPKGVRINSICPGTIVTGIFTRGGYSGSDDTEKFLADMQTAHPLGRVGQPEETAKAITFLASDAASFVSGVTLPVYGARHNTSWLPKSQM